MTNLLLRLLLFAVLLACVHGWSSPVDRRQAIIAATTAFVAQQQPAHAATIDVNNALAREFTAFPGLYPTIATKIVNAAKEKPFESKKEVYVRALTSDLERDRLHDYDKSIVIHKPDAALKQFKTSQICKYECGSRVSNSYRDDQIRAVQEGRRSAR